MRLEVRCRARRVPRAREDRRSRRRVVPSRRARPTRHRLGSAAQHEPAPVARVVPCVPTGTPPRAPTRVRRARTSRVGSAMGAARLASWADLPCDADAVDGIDLPHRARRVVGRARARADRARPARADELAARRVPLHHADLAAHRARRRQRVQPHGEAAPAGRAPGDDLRVREPRVHAHLDHERARANEEPRPDPRRGTALSRGDEGVAAVTSPSAAHRPLARQGPSPRPRGTGSSGSRWRTPR